MAIAVAGVGIAWMFGREMQLGSGALAGMAVALAVPLAGAANWTVLQHISHGNADPDEPSHDMLPAVWIGAVLSALASLPLGWPLRASGHDLALLALLGVLQLAIPCLLAVWLARVLPGARDRAAGAARSDLRRRVGVARRGRSAGFGRVWPAARW